MPFPWKKAKVTRISRLVADLHQSPKRGGSLVVETGFPTSLIDLFVKNRDRLRKSSKRKSSPSSSPPQMQTPPTLHQPSSPPKLFPSPPCKEELRSPDVDVGQLVLVKRECEERIAFHAAFKIFLVVALAVSSRNLAVWFMVAAFLLVLVEFVGTRFFGFLRPESKMLFLDSWIQKGLLVLKRWDWEQGSAQELVVKQQGTLFSDSYGLTELEDDCVEEIQIAESKFDSVDKGCDSESLETQIKVEGMEKIREILICRSERSRSARIKANLIRKLVPKKLRNGKKQGKSNDTDEPCTQSGVEIDKSDKIEEGKQGPEADDGEDESQVEVEEESCKQVEELGDRISTCAQLLWVEESGMGVVKNKVGNDRKGKSGYLILFVIVLAGLVGGRGLALLLTLVWCLIVRYIGFGGLRRC
ncbi:Ethylene-responsive nuclear / ethylene-regulated nuclear protein (ERT2)-like protein [Theobroma cacao]|uniref:Ethylene-responsive nuclear / ethylene-regulated nuclear protein (ERT2)-like protein n=1 Tax=Theobroma cacao TaxID=3641 RepID=A0A061G7X2_THECC|nr:Ethylene-responsive nuclear / ethylene-regulated nuclear protein (ERT2)-like protein [Theobroma cacao]